MAAFLDYVFTIPFFILLVGAVISLMIWLPYNKRLKRMRAIENDYPGFLKAIARHVKGGHSIESGLVEASRTRHGYIKEVVDKILADVNGGHTLDEALARSRYETESDIIQKVLSILRAALTQNAPIAEILEGVADELWLAYLLKLDRQEQTKSPGNLILWGGIVFTPAVIGFIITMLTGQGALGIDLDIMIKPMELFVIVLGPMSSMMFGVVCDRMDRGVILMPLHTFISYATMGLTLGIILTLQGH